MGTRIYNPNMGSADVLANPGQGDDPAEFNASGVAIVSDVSLFAPNFGLVEPGLPGLNYQTYAGNATTVVTVPAGKWWRLVGCNIIIVTDANVANRDIVVTLRDSADTTIEALTHASVTASTTAAKHIVYGEEALTGVDQRAVGNLGVAAEGTLTLDTNPTAADTMVLEGTTFTFVAALTGAANEILIEADLATTKTTIEDAVGVTPAAGNHSVSDQTRLDIKMQGTDFSGDDMVFTADIQGTDGNAHTTTETFTAGTNVFDAATLGTTTAGVGVSLLQPVLDFPEDLGPLLLAAEDIVVATTNGVAGDTLYTFISYIEYDADPTLAAGIGASV
jgi:hypothetical protein